MRLVLKVAILTSGKSQRQVAAETGIPENRLSEIVRGWRVPSQAEIQVLSVALQRPADTLFSTQTPPSSATGMT